MKTIGQTGHLLYQNIIKRPVRSTALLLLAAFLSLSVYAGTVLIGALRNGFSSLESRLGADIMVVPYEAATKSDLENIVLQGNTGYFYMDGKSYDKIMATEGIGQASSQYFLASTKAGCCSIPVQIIGYDPQTDFAITPWVRRSNGGQIGYLDVVVGNDLNIFVGDTMKLFDTEVRVAAKLDKTGTSYDTCVFTTRDTIKTLIAASVEHQLNDYGNINADNVVSCVLINVADGYAIEDVLNDINVHVKKVKAVRTKNMIADIAGSLAGISDVAAVLMVAVWIAALLVMVIAFLMMVNERKREFAVLRVVGASRRKLARLVLAEGVAVALVGSALGVALGSLVIFPFADYIEQRLGLPFLLPPAGMIVAAGGGAMALAVVAGACASGVAAYRIARLETASILRAAE